MPTDDGPGPRPRARGYWFFWTVGVVGRVMIGAGVILLLFVAYQLWGTGLHTRQAQNRLEDELAQRQAEVQADAPTPPTDDTLPGEEPVALAPDQLTPVEEARPLGQISIPRIGSDWVYLEGVDLAYLKDGPGHFPTTRRPGQRGNAALAGHRTTYGAPFHRIDELEPGDPITVTDLEGRTFTYEVIPAGELADEMPFDVEPEDADDGHFIIGPRDNWILDDYKDNRLTLMACHPKYSARERIVVVAELVGNPAPTPDEPPAPPDADGTEVLLANESGALLPAILWAAAAALVALGFWLLGRFWRRWPAYLIGAPIFLVVLFGCFVQVERLLPAAY